MIISAPLQLLSKSLPESNLEDYSAQLTRLPFPPELQVGMKLDGYRVIREIFASSRSQLYLVRDEIERDGQEHYYAMKTPSRNIEEDLSAIDRFIQEEWIGRRIHSPRVVKVIQQQRARTALYYLMEYVDGIGLDKWIAEHQPPSPKQSIAIVKQIAEGLKVFHNNEAIHQDLKPANIMLSNESILSGHPEGIDCRFWFGLCGRAGRVTATAYSRRCSGYRQLFRSALFTWAQSRYSGRCLCVGDDYL